MGTQQDVPMWVRVDLSPRGKTELKPAEDLGEVTLTVTNLSTGEIFYDTFDSVAATQSLTPISGSLGYYKVVYFAECGDIYNGSFTLEN